MANENEKRETLADILAIVRRAAQYYDGEAEKSEGLLRETFKLSAANYREIANLVEAAWKREKAELVYSYNPEKVGKGRLPDGSAYALEAMREPVTGSHAVGNAAAMRDALEKIYTCVDDCYNYDPESKLDEVIGIADAALAAPARNCDVGNAEEHAQRFYNFCESNSSGINGMCKPTCPCIDCFDKCQCFAKWAQMPYEDEEGGAK